MKSEYAWLELLPGRLAFMLTEADRFPDGLGAVQTS